MVLPVIAVAARSAAVAARGAARGSKKAARARKRLRKSSADNNEGKENPYFLSVEGLLMLFWALIVDAINILLGILDFVGVGLILSPIWNVLAIGTIGLWLWIRTGQGFKKTRRKKRLVRVLVKKIAIPFLGNSIPLVKFFPFWLWSVWSSLEKGGSPQPQPEPQETTPSPMY